MGIAKLRLASIRSIKATLSEQQQQRTQSKTKHTRVSVPDNLESNIPDFQNGDFYHVFVKQRIPQLVDALKFVLWGSPYTLHNLGFCSSPMLCRWHVYGEGELIEPPTATRFGKMRYTCARCGGGKEPKVGGWPIEYVSCSCGAEGPKYSSKAMAILSWNRRCKIVDDAQFGIAVTCCDILAAAKSDETKSEVSKFRMENVCRNSKIGQYYCAINVPFGTRFSCDLCLEAELYTLWRNGIHTVGSCCGHGKKNPYIQVASGQSVQKMHELGYEMFQKDDCGNGENCFKPKTILYLPEGGAE